MASPKISGDQGDHPFFGYFKDNFRYWEAFVTPEPISSDLRRKVRLDLQKQWYSERLNYFRRSIHANWTRPGSEEFLLDSELGDIASLEKARFFCNRPSGFYWSQDIQRAAKRERFSSPPTAIFASKFSEWYRQYDNQPNIEFDHFVANPIQITERGPDTIRGIIRAHVSLHEKAKKMLHNINPGETTSGHCKQPRVEDYRIHPLYQALILIVDRHELRDRLDEFRRPDGYIRLQDIAHFQSVIIARTGVEEQLSAPVSFESLHDKALPLERVDYDGEANIDVIRVPLPDAVRFVVDLEKREDAVTYDEMAAPSIQRSLDMNCCKVLITDGDVCDNRYNWADQHIIAAEKHGCQHCDDTIYKAPHRHRACLLSRR